MASSTSPASGAIGADRDTLVAIGGNHDTVLGGTGDDLFWIDTTDQVGPQDRSISDFARIYFMLGLFGGYDMP